MVFYVPVDLTTFTSLYAGATPVTPALAALTAASKTYTFILQVLRSPLSTVTLEAAVPSLYVAPLY